MSEGHQRFTAWISAAIEDGPLPTADVLGACLPLLDQIAEAHAVGKVAPLKVLAGVRVDQGRLWFAAADQADPQGDARFLAALQPRVGGAVDVVREWHIDETKAEGIEADSIDAQSKLGSGKRLSYLPDWRCIEHELQVHDAPSDVYQAGMVLASLALGLDFSRFEDLKRFASSRDNLFALHAALDPTLARVIVRMTALARAERWNDVAQAATLLRNYRRLSSEATPDVQETLRTTPKEQRRAALLETLRDRLFEITRRNRLLYFRPTMGMLNATEASVPLVLDTSRIDPQSLFIWSADLAARLSAAQGIELEKVLRFEDVPYVPGLLDRLRSEDARSRREFGFSPLRLTLVFLRWHDLKGEKSERIHSPLLLLPVAIEKKKGVRDRYRLVALDEHAEVNPALRHHLQRLYGLQLPESVPLNHEAVLALHEDLARQIAASEAAVELRRIDRPRIELLHRRARARLDVWRKRTRGRAEARRFGAIDYSYATDRMMPLGIELYRRHVVPPALTEEEFVRETPGPRTVEMAGTPPEAEADSKVRERSFFRIDQEGAANPYNWDFDLCALTIGHFHYRRMSLVRDYAQLTEDEELSQPSFDALFPLGDADLNPTTTADEVAAAAPPIVESPLAELYPIVPCDPTQMTTLRRARAGESFLIQGPPGTGKSQTITNLIADQVALGKRVLFVCEKRAAIDVVHERLKTSGLERLCVLIHDSQGDKKEFIQELKATYEDWVARDDDAAAAEKTRTNAVRDLERNLASLTHFDSAMQSSSERDALALRPLLARAIELSGAMTAAATADAAVRDEMSDEEAERWPGYEAWLTGGEQVRALEHELQETGLATTVGASVLARLHEALLHAERPLAAVETAWNTAHATLESLQRALEPCAALVGSELEVAALRDLIQRARELEALARANALDLLNAQSTRRARLRTLASERKVQRAAVEIARSESSAWKNPPPASDLEHIIALCQRVEGAMLRWLRPSWWKLKRLVRERYDFAAHPIEPEIGVVLEKLRARYAAEAELQEIDVAARAELHIELDAETLEAQLLAAESAPAPVGGDTLRERCATEPTRHLEVLALAAAAPAMEAFGSAEALLWSHAPGGSLAQRRALLDELRAVRTRLPEVLIQLQRFATIPTELCAAVLEVPRASDEIEQCIVEAAILRRFRADRSLHGTSGRELEEFSTKLGGAWDALRAANGAHVVALTHRRLKQLLARATATESGGAPEEVQARKAIQRGRKELEHEFGKVMRWKSIRDLAAGDTGIVLRALKPVWLMSPLSVSDTLPLETAAFDVVIFDEASQIPLEESVPTLFRGGQAIVVGDEKQLPPTNFFSASKDSDEDALIFRDEDGTETSVELEAESFLTHAAGYLPSCMLGWHYRSRSEALIRFSNAAFYGRNLLTIPDVAISESRPAISVPAEFRDLDDAALAGRCLDRPIAFHKLEAGLYSKQRNPAEAAYVARLVRSLLRAEKKRSLGVVAFSQAQQAEIEQALEDLAAEDEVFAEALAVEEEREEDGAFVGLFVKNLENVQGDERDIIILSVCYGPDARGKVLMNFGPINQGGGEKRLNVVFSRAKHHMVVVASMGGERITNTWNDGALCFQRYLRYAEAISLGREEAAQRILEEFAPDADLEVASEREALIEALATALRSEGIEVHTGIGASRFRTDLALRRAGEERFRLGILVDTVAHYATSEVLERHVLRPRILGAFGWKVARVFAKDWYSDPQATLTRLRKHME